MPAHARAGEAHLLAIVNAAELARQASGAARAERMKAYEALLREHLSSWPNDKSADQARLWLGQLLESQREWRAAAATYRAVNAQHAEHEAAQRGALRAAELALQSAAAADRFDAEFQQDAARFAETLIVGPERQWPEKWSPLQLESALAAARLRLNYFVAGANLEPTERLLTTALAANPNAPAAWQAEARLLLIWAMTLQGQSAAALAQLDQLAGGTLASLLQVLEKCDALAAGAEDKQAIELAELALQLSRRIDSRQVELSETERRQFQTLQAAALVRAGHFGDALRLYQTLVARHPRDGAIQEAYAALLARATDSPSRRVALSKWREVESKTKAGEPRWFRARLAQAELLMQLNDQAAARKLLQLTAVLHPELGGPEMKARFEALLNSSGQ